MPKRELCYTHVKYATCYDGLGRVGEAAGAVRKAVDLIAPVQETECVNEMDAEAFGKWMYERFAEFTSLHVFLQPRCVFLPPESASNLSVQERLQIMPIIKKAKAIQEFGRKTKEMMEQVSSQLAGLEELLRLSSLRDSPKR